MSPLNASKMHTADTHHLIELQCEKLDEEHTQDLQERVTEIVEQSSTLPIIVDLGAVRSMPSLSIGALVAMQQQTKQRNQRFILASLSDAVRQVLAMCRLDMILEIQDSPQAAIQKLQSQAG
jgi:anti-anti-sigma factor